MSFSVGIIGLPNVGKSTLFKALTQQEVDISNYPFCTIDPNVGVVQVPDERLNKIAEIVKPQKTTPTIIEFVDIAGLVKGAHKGEGLGNQFLAHIREVDAIAHVVRSFEASDIKHIENTLDVQRDIDIVNTELIMKDLETMNKYLEKIEKPAATRQDVPTSGGNQAGRENEGILNNIQNWWLNLVEGLKSFFQKIFSIL